MSQSVWAKAVHQSIPSELVTKRGRVLDSRNPVTPKEQSLRRLVSTATQGDQEAWSGIVQRYNGLVFAVARNHRLSSADAADVAQTTWLRLFENMRSLRNPERLGSWLAVTARHEALRALQKAAKYVLIPEEDALEPSQPLLAGPETDILKAERDADLWRAVEQIPSRCQRLLGLLMSEPRMSYREIAAALDVPVGSIGPTRARCLECLRRVTENLAA